MNLEENQRVDLATHLRRKNFRVSGGLKNGGRAISIPAFGLWSYAAAYCGSDDLIEETATALTEVPGVDFVVYRDQESVMVNGTKGTARIERNDKLEYRYVTVTGDPLDLGAIISRLNSAGGMNTTGFVSSSEWFETTNSHRYPNAVVNVYDSIMTCLLYTS